MKYINSIAIALLMTLTLPAAEITGQTLQEYLSEAGENHPGLQAAYKEYYAALEEVKQVGTLPDPKLSFGYFVSPVETRLGPQKLKFSVSQMFPWFGTLSEKEKAAAEKAKMEYQKFIKLKNKIFQQVKSKWYELYKTGEAIRITEKNIDILESLQSLSRRNYQTDKSKMTDVLRINVNIREQENKLKDLEEKLTTQKTEFNALLNRQSDKPLQIPDTIYTETFDIVEYRDSIPNNPKVAALEHRKNALEHKYEVARKKGFPNFTLALDYAVIGERTDMQVANSGRDVVMPMAGISIPLYRKKYNAMKKQTKLQISSVNLQRDNMLNQLSEEYRKAEEQYKEALRDIDLYKQQVKESERLYSLLKTSYSSDGQNFFELMRTRLMVLKYELKLEQAKANQNIAVAKLEHLTNQNQ
jgi:outer membrane protein TolC